MQQAIDIAIGWIAHILYYLSPAVVFLMCAFAWQKYPNRAFLLLALSSMLVVLLVAMDAIEAAHPGGEADALAYWRCRNLIIVADGILYPWGLFLLFRFIRERTPDGKSGEQDLP